MLIYGLSFFLIIRITNLSAYCINLLYHKKYNKTTKSLAHNYYFKFTKTAQIANILVLFYIL